VGNREGWKLCIVIGGVIVGILPMGSFSASHDMGFYLNRIMFETLMIF
jgi:hypothetical protein